MNNNELDRELETWDNFNDRLIFILAQDLKRPFSSMIMMAEMLKLIKEPLSQQELNRILEELKNTASQSMELLDGLLYWIRLKEEGFVFKTQPLLLNDLIHEANSWYASDQLKKNSSFFNAIPQLQVVYTHKQMLLFITRNILSNITALSPAGSNIGVTSVADENWITVAFTAPKQEVNAMQPDKLFNTTDADIKANPELRESAMAMRICLDMIQQMNGRLWQGSTEDEDTTFYYALPKGRA